MELQLNYISLFPCIAWPVYLLITTDSWLNVLLTLYGLGLSHQSNIQRFYDRNVNVSLPGVVLNPTGGDI